MTDNDNILSEEDFQRINKGIQESERAEQIIQLAEQAGMDVSGYKQKAKETRAQLLRIKQTFFPGRT